MGYFVFQRRCFLAPASPPPLPLKSGGTLSVAQRDSAVSDYKPCAEEPPAQSASLWGRNSTQDSGGTRENRGISADRSFTELGFLTSNAAELRIYHPQVILILFYFIFYLSISLFSPGQDTQLRSLLDERELGTSLGKTKHIISWVVQRQTFRF